ncbi:hypothetical protein AN619_30270 [Thermotalea metallivorans]|uniref:Uncharacterized protein n=1 Tax=Thermotalea metallivorans TaxID=520762 RepID=A0A140KZD4_9FIRM|nr:hypothetical protein AN619_30270 [Thermotalea metallivorans]
MKTSNIIKYLRLFYPIYILLVLSSFRFPFLVFVSAFLGVIIVGLILNIINQLYIRIDQSKTD